MLASIALFTRGDNMKKFAAIATLGIMSLTLLAGSAVASPGADVYKAKCAMCHGADGAGAMAKKMGSKISTRQRSKRCPTPTSQT